MKFALACATILIGTIQSCTSSSGNNVGMPFKLEYKEERFGSNSVYSGIFDEYGTTIIAKGNRYFGYDIEVDSVLAFWYSRRTLVARVRTTASASVYVVCSDTIPPAAKGDWGIAVVDSIDKESLQRMTVGKMK